MKRKSLHISMIALVAVCLLLLYVSGFGHNLICISQVEKIELTVCVEDGTETVRLNKEEIAWFIMHYNLSRYVGEVKAEKCDRMFYVSILLKDGRQIGIVDHENERMGVMGLGEQSFWVDNALLLRFVEGLVSDRGLLWKTWGDC